MDEAKIGMVAAPLEQGFYLTEPALAVITEAQLFGQQVMQRRLRKRREQDADAIIRDLSELKIGAPVVHVDYGVGRYAGLMTLQTGDFEAELSDRRTHAIHCTVVLARVACVLNEPFNAPHLDLLRRRMSFRKLCHLRH